MLLILDGLPCFSETVFHIQTHQWKINDKSADKVGIGLAVPRLGLGEGIGFGLEANRWV